MIDTTPAKQCRGCGAWAAIGEWRTGICVICRDKRDRLNESSNTGDLVAADDETHSVS